MLMPIRVPTQPGVRPAPADGDANAALQPVPKGAVGVS